MQEKKTISESGVYMYQVVGEQKNYEIVVTGKSDVKLFFLIHKSEIGLNIDIQDEGGSVDCSIVVLSANREVSSIDFSVGLHASETKASVYALSLLGDRAKAKVNGGIVINPGIVKAEGYLTEENLLLGENISIKTLPMLDVRSNDVKASHGATIQRLDPQKLFYLNAKGLSQELAQRLMIQSYMQKSLDHVGVAEEKSNSMIEDMFARIGM